MTEQDIKTGVGAVAAPMPVKPKFPLAGMPFDRDDLAKATKHAFQAALHRGKPVRWAEARKLGYRWLVKMHFPS